MQSLLGTDSTSLPSYLTGLLEIDTKAIAHNYKTFHGLLPHSICAAVLKADAYGFGIKAIAPVLEQTGCQHFFVAHLEEGITLRKLLKNPFIYVLSGLLPKTEDLFVENNLTPVLNDFGMVKEWAAEAQKRNQKLPCALHFDTGMHRSGLDNEDVDKLFRNLGLLQALDVQFVMSHLVTSHEPRDPLNEKQRILFDDLRKHFPQAKASLADTGGIYLGPSYHYDLARPGKGLFGLYTPPEDIPALQTCVKLSARILQIHTAPRGDSVGYDATHFLTRETKLATLGVGFADGYDRRLGNSTYVEIKGFKAPVIGRISMDYTVVDVTDIPESTCYVGGWAELVNETLTLDMLANSIGTISRELSTGFGQRMHRLYRS